MRSKKYVALTLLALLAKAATAQVTPPPPVQPPPGPGLPIDGNIILLIVSGLILGSYILYRKLKTK